MTHQDRATAATPRRKPFDPENVGKIQRTSELGPVAESDIKAALKARGCGIVRRPVWIDVAAVAEAPQQSVQRDWLMVSSGQQPSLRTLLLVTSLRTGITMADLKSPRRSRPVVRARMIFIALAKMLTTQSLPQIGRAVGNRDHSTVLHAIRTVAENPGHFEPELGEIRGAVRSEVVTP